MPQSFPELETWAADAGQRGLIDANDRQVLADYARYGAEVVKVDDFPADFGMLEALQRRLQALQQEPEEVIA
jgi:acyl-CoA dehydrogenase